MNYFDAPFVQDEMRRPFGFGRPGFGFGRPGFGLGALVLAMGDLDFWTAIFRWFCWRASSWVASCSRIWLWLSLSTAIPAIWTIPLLLIMTI